jgi:YadA-like membrane anchor domain
MRRIINLMFLLFLMSAPAAAQITSPLDPNQTYIPIIQFQSGSTCGPDGFCITERAGIQISTFATVTQLNALSTRLDDVITMLTVLGPQLSSFDARLTSLSNQVGTVSNQIGTINNTLVAMDSHLASIDKDLSKALEGAALAAAIKDALPNPGDRFAVRLNAAGAGGEFAGAVGFSYNVVERARIHVNYGRSESQNAVSGGVNLSFH